MASPDSSTSRSSQGGELPVLFFLLAGVGWVAWHFGNKTLLALALKFRGWEMGLLGHLPFFREAGNFRDTARAVSGYSRETLETYYTWTDFARLSKALGEVVSWPAAGLLAIGGFYVATRGLGSCRRNFIRTIVKADNGLLRLVGKGITDILGPVRSGNIGKRFGWKVLTEFDVPSFVRELGETFPQVLPVASCPPSVDPALSDLDFVVREGILTGPDGKRPDPVKLPSGALRFDRSAARVAFSAQLGNRFADEPGNRLSDCPAHIWGIVAVCLARLSGPAGKDDSEFLIEELARMFGSPKNGNKGEEKTRKTLVRMIGKYERNAEALRAMRDHGFVNTALPAVFAAAKKYGQLTTSDFVWLKAVDRPLFYALNQVGRKVSWVEAAGCRAHADAEEAKGEPLFEPHVDKAVEALERRLMKLGYLNAGGKKG
ncbi:hypothetical protein [Leptospirillum ferriphilum]|uniref:secretion/conjugation apparatus DotM-related subunit n=1 Tax=Leptospirillum ferriphilum TaxID=178606 RepID=UPI0006B1736A|nr:hypothetical protein [Leptospirillum ferriphilum]